MSEERQPTGKRPPRMPLSAGQLVQLAQACASGRPTDARDQAILALLTTTGLRAQELCALSLDQLHEGGLTVPTAKVGGTRELHLTQGTEWYVRAYITGYRRPCREEERTIFLTHDGQRLDVGTLAHIVRGAAARAQLADRHVSVALIRYSVGALRFGALVGQQDEGENRPL